MSAMDYPATYPDDDPPEDVEEECVFCGVKQSPWEFEDGLRCKTCVEADEVEEE